MKKIILLFVFIIQFGYSQQTTSFDFNYQINLKEIANTANPKNKLVKFDYDFSNIKSSNLIFSIEIITLYDCFNGINADYVRETILISNTDKTVKNKDSFMLEHLALQAKCFKYRVLIKTDSEFASEWNYYTFIK